MYQLLKRKVRTSESAPILLIIQRKVEYNECISVDQTIYHRKVCNDTKCTYYSKTILLSPCSLVEMSISSSSPVLPPPCGQSVPVGTSLWPMELVEGRGGLAEGLQMGREIAGEGAGDGGDRVGAGGEAGRRGEGVGMGGGAWLEAGGAGVGGRAGLKGAGACVGDGVGLEGGEAGAGDEAGRGGDGAVVAGDGVGAGEGAWAEGDGVRPAGGGWGFADTGEWY